LARLEELDRLLADYRSRVATAPSKVLVIIESLFARPVISADSISRAFGVTHQTAMNWIRRLQVAKILTDSTKSGREMLYIASELL
jgi:hypothetical protein